MNRGKKSRHNGNTTEMVIGLSRESVQGWWVGKVGVVVRLEPHNCPGNAQVR